MINRERVSWWASPALCALVVVGGENLGCCRQKAPGEEQKPATVVASETAPGGPRPAAPGKAGDNAFASPETIPSLFSALPKPVRIISMQLKPHRVKIDVQDNTKPEEANTYWYRKGTVDGPIPMKNRMAKLKTGKVLDLASIDFAVVSRIIADAKKRTGIERVRSIDMMRGTKWRVRLEDGRKRARVDYDLSGGFIAMK